MSDTEAAILMRAQDSGDVRALRTEDLDQIAPCGVLLCPECFTQ